VLLSDYNKMRAATDVKVPAEDLIAPPEDSILKGLGRGEILATGKGERAKLGIPSATNREEGAARGCPTRRRAGERRSSRSTR